MQAKDLEIGNVIVKIDGAVQETVTINEAPWCRISYAFSQGDVLTILSLEEISSDEFFIVLQRPTGNFNSFLFTRGSQFNVSFDHLFKIL